MVRRDAFALLIVLLLSIVFPIGLLGYQAVRVGQPAERTVELVARTAADGGWQPDAIRVNQGERVRLRVTSADVVHGFTAPALGIEVEEVGPGRVVEVEFVAERAGRFAFACTRWCSPDHWRMRGTIEVVGAAVAASGSPRAKPLYQQLGLNPDVMRSLAHPPSERPSAKHGVALARPLAPDLLDPEWLRRNAPGIAFERLRAESANANLSDDDVWSLVALAWQGASSTATLAEGESLYRRDCAACHGEGGRGDGLAGRKLPGKALMNADAKRGPADFTDASQMLSASDALLQGKILRGGMGTGMPEWGSLHNDDSLWSLVAYLRTFTFDYKR